jgi:hypothetical protein
MNIISNPIDLDPVTDENRDQVFKEALTALERMDGKGKQVEKTTLSTKATHKLLCISEGDRIDITGPISDSSDLKPNEFWWPCRFNGVDYDVILSKWLLFGNVMASTNAKKDWPSGLPISNDSKKWIKDEIARIEGKIEVTQDQWGDATSIYFDAAAYLVMAKELVACDNNDKLDCVWKALEYAYQAGWHASEADASTIRHSAKKGHKFPSGRMKKSLDNLKDWEKEVLKVWETAPQTKWSSQRDHLIAHGYVKKVAGYRILIVETQKDMAEGTFKNRISTLRKLS